MWWTTLQTYPTGLQCRSWSTSSSAPGMIWMYKYMRWYYWYDDVWMARFRRSTYCTIINSICGTLLTALALQHACWCSNPIPPYSKQEAWQRLAWPEITELLIKLTTALSFTKLPPPFLTFKSKWTSEHKVEHSNHKLAGRDRGWQFVDRDRTSRAEH